MMSPCPLPIPGCAAALARREPPRPTLGLHLLSPAKWTPLWSDKSLTEDTQADSGGFTPRWLITPTTRLPHQPFKHFMANTEWVSLLYLHLPSPARAQHFKTCSALYKPKIPETPMLPLRPCPCPCLLSYNRIFTKQQHCYFVFVRTGMIHKNID